MFEYDPTRHVTLFETPHGSRLYGNARPDSDYDLYRVVENDPLRVRGLNAGQTIVTDEKTDRTDDVTVVDLTTFMAYVAIGVPQYLEACYSRIPTVDVLGPAFRLGLRPSLATARSKYVGAVARHWARGLAEDNYKTLRHAHRFAYEWTIVRTGRVFNPTLTDDEWAIIEEDVYADPFERWSLESTVKSDKELAKIST